MLYHYKQVALCAFLFFSYCMATAQPVNRYDVVISEIMADPSPSVQLPASEWVELHNTSGTSVNLQGCRLADATGTSGPLPAFVLQPDSFVVICASSALPALLPLGPAIAVTAFPSLDNGGDLLQLRSPQGSTLHAVGYADTWYQNDLKREGGWTLEMIDTRNPCTGHGNWMASTDAKGGTPGRRNSVAATRTDVSAPRLLRAFATDSLSLTLVFNEPLDSARAAVPGSYAIDGLAAPVAAVCLPPLFNRVVLQPGSPLLRNKVYTVNAKASITDCRGNALGSGSTARVGLATMADSLAVVLNELLFNPRPGGTDYVELYNRSPQVIDLQQLFLANRSATGTLTNIRPLSNGPHLLFPQGFAVATDDPELVRTQYIAQDLDAFVTVAPLPAMSNDKGHLVLLNAQGRVVDQLAYTEKWHYPLVGNAEGIALERIDYNAPTQQPDNWHSAASSVGHGTPTYPNSQRRANAPLPGSLSVTPAICSPNNDGQDDFVTVAYQFPEPGYVANCTLFDAGGRPVRLLQRNMLCGTQGSFKWDGLGQKNQRLPKGIYIVYTEVFNLQGKTGRFKQVVTLVD